MLLTDWLQALCDSRVRSSRKSRRRKQRGDLAVAAEFLEIKIPVSASMLGMVGASLFTELSPSPSDASPPLIESFLSYGSIDEVFQDESFQDALIVQPEDSEVSANPQRQESDSASQTVDVPRLTTAENPRKAILPAVLDEAVTSHLHRSTVRQSLNVPTNSIVSDNAEGESNHSSSSAPAGNGSSGPSANTHPAAAPAVAIPSSSIDAETLTASAAAATQAPAPRQHGEIQPLQIEKQSDPAGDSDSLLDGGGMFFSLLSSGGSGGPSGGSGGVNEAPFAADDNYSIAHDTTLMVSSPGVIGNDWDSGGDDISNSAMLDAGPSNGTLTYFNPDGSFEYVPNPGWTGPDTFTYHVNDGLEDSNVATVTIDVTNEAPFAEDDSYSIVHDTTLTEPAAGVIGNDSDSGGDDISNSAMLDAGPSNGTLTYFNPDGSFEYVPNLDWAGTDTFTYHVNDGLEDSNIATVTIDVTNETPIATEDEYSVLDTHPYFANQEYGVLANDFDSDGDALVAVLVSGPSYATDFSLNPDGSFTYVPTIGYLGWDSFIYKVYDGVSYSLVVAANIAVDQIVIRSGELRSDPPPEPMTPEDIYNFSEVDPTQPLERWIGELVVVDVKAKGPRPPAIASYQWTIPGSLVKGFYVSEDQQQGHALELEPDDYTYPGVEFYWYDGSGAATYAVEVDLVLADGTQVHREAPFDVKEPTLNVQVAVDQVNWSPPNPNNPFAYEYQLGDEFIPNPSGIKIDAVVTNGPAGFLDWAQLIDMEAQAFFPKAPGIAADPDVGPGHYLLASSGLDEFYPTYRGNNFDDSPAAYLPRWTAGENGFVDYQAEFSTYILWVSNRAGSIGAPVYQVDWSWWFTADTAQNVNQPEGWEWAAPAPGQHGVLAIQYVSSTYPEWADLSKLDEKKWAPLG